MTHLLHGRFAPKCVPRNDKSQISAISGVIMTLLLYGRSAPKCATRDDKSQLFAGSAS